MPEPPTPTRVAPPMHIVDSQLLDPQDARGKVSGRTYLYDSERRRPRFIEEFLALIAYRDLVLQLVSRNVKTRYKRSVLGVAWTMINPLMMMTVLAIVFSTLFTAKIENYPVFLLTGLTLWGFFQQTS